ncbi:hypothetical protein C4K39_0838 [Pseudomonas sessilinigenes]|nr:hypothetical protein C4K39_0838 [Pseudomonas sessilinigenes]
MWSESGKRPAWKKPDRALRLEPASDAVHLHAAIHRGS